LSAEIVWADCTKRSGASYAKGIVCGDGGEGDACGEGVGCREVESRWAYKALSESIAARTAKRAV